MSQPINPADRLEKQTLPNIVLFISDQWRSKDVGCLVNPVIRTPHTDRLAEEGVDFCQLTKVPHVIKYPNSISIPKRGQPVDSLVELVSIHNRGQCACFTDIPLCSTFFD